MEKDFWLQCWQNNHIAFHQLSFHPWLSSTIKQYLTTQPMKTFVPLCGKSDDLLWFAEQGSVTGSELSDIACRDFFNAKQFKHTLSASGEHTVFRHDNISIWQGDFFKLTPSLLGNFDCIYDRAALVALPKNMQVKYAKHLTQFIEDRTKLFVIAVEFDDNNWQGPPFNVSEDDIKRLFSGYAITQLAASNVSDKKFAQRKMSVNSLRETLYLIEQNKNN